MNKQYEAKYNPIVKLGRYKLSLRQYEVCQLIQDGLTNKEIGYKLHITEKTVKFHLTRIFKILDVNSRLRLSKFMYELGV